jgi:hypothetical protein
MLSKMLSVVVATLLFGASLAQRPPNATICDYYTVKLYGSNTSDTQNKLMQSIIALAFGGGANLENATDITGVFNPGNFQGTPVDLHTWFDGSKATTNLNNVPVGINWLDGGGAQPLNNYLTSGGNTFSFKNTTNQ